MARVIRGTSPGGVDWVAYERFRAWCLRCLVATDDPGAAGMRQSDLPPESQERFIRSMLEARAGWARPNDFSHAVIAAMKDGDLP